MQDFIQHRTLPLLLQASWQGAVIVLLVLVAQFTVGRRWNPRWRHALWWLVVIRLALPATIPSPLSLFNLLPIPGGITRVVNAGGVTGSGQVQALPRDANDDPGDPPPAGGRVSPWFWLWAAGALFMAASLGANHYRLHGSVTRRRPFINEPVMNLLEDCKQRMGIRVPVTLVETAAVEGSCLFGVLRPRLLLPPGFTGCFSLDELRYVFLHELGHVKRHDIFLGWLMAWLQILHWFNPLVWLAFSRMRVDREVACDALALSHAEEEANKPYGRTIVKLLENFGESLRAPSLAGIAEDKQQMKERITMIAKFQRTNRGFAAAACLLAVLGVVTLTDAQNDGNPSGGGAQTPGAAPRIVSSSPKSGASSVDPGLTEITVTFDQDMEAGMSWTGGPPDFPKSPEGTKAHWRDQRTCVLPVILQPGRSYRVGINSQSHQNFRGVNGIATQPSAIFFKTSGTRIEPKAPEIVSLSPVNGALDVNPALKELRVTFNVAMGGGFSWTGGGPNFPTAPEGTKPYWTKDGKTCVLPVELQPGQEYRLGLNSPSFHGFQSDEGVPLKPVIYTFKTSGGP